MLLVPAETALPRHLLMMQQHVPKLSAKYHRRRTFARIVSVLLADVAGGAEIYPRRNPVDPVAVSRGHYLEQTIGRRVCCMRDTCAQVEQCASLSAAPQSRCYEEARSRPFGIDERET